MLADVISLNATIHGTKSGFSPGPTEQRGFASQPQMNKGYDGSRDQLIKVFETDQLEIKASKRLSPPYRSERKHLKHHVPLR